MRASGRSILLITRITGRSWASALRSTKRVCGQRALGGVDEQDDAVDHGERPLDLATEVGVAGRVDDVQRDSRPDCDRGVLGEDRDALLTLEVARVHDALVDGLVGAERARLVQHRVDERGLAVVDVGDDGQVADVGTVPAIRPCGRGRSRRRPPRWRARRLQYFPAVFSGVTGCSRRFRSLEDTTDHATGDSRSNEGRQRWCDA